MIKRKVALITGASGFIGYNLTDRLLKEGWIVNIILRENSNIFNPFTNNNLLIIHLHDGSTENLIKIMEKASPSVVFHLASLFISEHCSDQVESLIKSNILFGTQLLEAMFKCEVNYLINTGTSWQHYNDEKYNPVNLYASTKQAYETIIKYYIEVSPIKVLTLKLFDTFGPNDGRKKIINLLCESLVSQKTLLMSPGDQLIDLVFIDDVVEAYLNAIDILGKSEEKYLEYFISSRKLIKLKEIVNMINELSGQKANVEWGKRNYRKREVMVPYKFGTSLPEWECKVSLKEGLTRLLNNNKLR